MAVGHMRPPSCEGRGGGGGGGWAGPGPGEDHRGPFARRWEGPGGRWAVWVGGGRGGAPEGGGGGGEGGKGLARASSREASPEALR